MRLDAESWDRLTTWIDMNRPNHGTWSENVGAKRMGRVAERRAEMQRRYANLDEAHEVTYGVAKLAAPALPHGDPPPPPPPARSRYNPPTCATRPRRSSNSGR